MVTSTSAPCFLDRFDNPAGSANKLRATRLVRLLRLLKLLRVLRASRLWRRIESRISVSYAIINICKFLGLMFMFSHWSACLWVLTAVLEDESDKTWVTEWFETRIDNGFGPPSQGPPLYEAKCMDQIPSVYQKRMWDNRVIHARGNSYNATEAAYGYGIIGQRNAAHWFDCYDVSELYLVSGYWSVMTLTSIGYGDIVPVNRMEHAVCALIMLVGGCIWAYILGSICAAAANLDPHTAQFQCTMDELNRFMKERGMPMAAQNRFRAFFIGSRPLAHSKACNQLIEMMSPALASQCVAHTHNALTGGSVFWLKNAPLEFVVDLVMQMDDMVFGPQEMMGLQDSLVVLRRGVATKDGTIVLPEVTWGQDIIFDQSWLRNPVQAFSMTLIEITHLRRDVLHDTLAQAPGLAQGIRKHVVPHVLLQAMRVAGTLMKQGKIEPTTDAIIAAFKQRVRWERQRTTGIRTPSPTRAARRLAGSPSPTASRGTISYHVVDANSRSRPLVSDSVALPDPGGVRALEGRVVGSTQNELNSATRRIEQITQSCQMLHQLADKQAEESRRMGNKIDFIVQQLYSKSISQQSSVEQASPKPRRARVKVVPGGDFVSI